MTVQLTEKNTACVLSRLKSFSGLTQTELAQKVGATQSTVSSWLTGRHFPEVSSLKQICSVCGAELLLDGVPLADANYKGYCRLDKVLRCAEEHKEKIAIRMPVPEGIGGVRKKKKRNEKGGVNDTVL